MGPAAMSAVPAVSSPEPPDTVEAALRAMIPKLPGPVRFRAQNALRHFDKALDLFEVDREMSSFRAITGEEEAAAALFKALQLQGYPDAEQLSVKNHTHKTAALACALAIRGSLAKGIERIHVTFDLAKPRIDVVIPFSELKVKAPPGTGVRPVEPLDILRAKADGSETNVYERELRLLAEGAKFAEIRQMVKARANARNTLLYASNKALPSSRAKRPDLLARKEHALLLIAVAVIALQTPQHQATLRQAIEALLVLVQRLPPEPPQA